MEKTKKYTFRNRVGETFYTHRRTLGEAYKDLIDNGYAGDRLELKSIEKTEHRYCIGDNVFQRVGDEQSEAVITGCKLINGKPVYKTHLWSRWVDESFGFTNPQVNP